MFSGHFRPCQFCTVQIDRLTVSLHGSSVLAGGLISGFGENGQCLDSKYISSGPNSFAPFKSPKGGISIRPGCIRRLIIDCCSHLAGRGHIPLSNLTLHVSFQCSTKTAAAGIIKYKRTVQMNTRGEQLLFTQTNQVV